MSISNEQILLLRQKCAGILLTETELLSNHTSFKIGGPARIMAFPTDAVQASSVLSAAKQCGIPTLILGAGTNVLMPDAGLDVLVVSTKQMQSRITLLPGNRIYADAGCTLSRVAVFARDHGLSGMECLHGIPGSVGGALYMNAGAYGSSVQDVLVSGFYVTAEADAMEIPAEQAMQGYRRSIFQNMQGMITGGTFQLTPAEPEMIRQKMNALMEKRKASQPLELPSAGSTFKRPEGSYAGMLIEQAGLKGKGVGRAAVSEKHAGFIVNLGGATSSDVLSTIRFVQEKVFEASGIRLEPEVRILNEDGTCCG